MIFSQNISDIGDKEQSFGAQHGVKIRLTLHGNQLKKYLGLHGYPFDIFKIVYRHSRGFLWAFRAKEMPQGMSLWYFAKLTGYLLFKRQNERKTCRIYASFPKFSKPIPNPCQILDESI